MADRHILLIQLPEDGIGLLFYEGATVRVQGGIPRDAKLLGVYADWEWRTICVAFEHPSFPLCPEGAVPQRQNISFEFLEHPMAETWDMIPLRVGLSDSEYLNMQRWICERAAEIEGRAGNATEPG